jgi:DNA-nicking Smr family endonuclease
MKVRRLQEAKKLNELKRRLREASDVAAPASAEEVALFRDLIGAVRPLSAPEAPVLAPRIAPDTAMRRLDDAMVVDELLDPPTDLALLDGSDQMAYLAAGYAPKLLKKLRAGEYRVSDEFDLHNMIQADAKKALHHFLHQAAKAGQRCLRVIHGKGLRSGSDGPVLKMLVDSELRRRKDVIAFVSAQPAQGGTGAVLILLANRVSA